MFSSKTLLCLLIVALSAVDAIPLSRRSGKSVLSFATRINELSILNIAEQDRARAQALQQVAQLGFGWSDSITNNLVNFAAEIWVGFPPTNYSLLIDTGSALTFMGVREPYHKTLTSEDTGNSVSASYGSGNWTGEQYIDTVMLTPELVIDRQSIGAVNKSQGISGVDGILGVGPVNLTEKTVENTYQVPTVMDNLYAQGTISEEVLGIYFVPASDPSGGEGELTFGGYDEQAVTSEVSYVPITTTAPANIYWGIDQSVTYGEETVLSLTAGIVDTGTTLILLATDAFQTYAELTGAVKDADTGLLSITPDQYNDLKTLTFHIGSRTYDLIPDAQIWPRSLNTRIGGKEDGIYLIVADAGTKSGSGLDFLNGYTFLERFYTVYDTTNKQVGFACTKYTDSKYNY